MTPLDGAARHRAREAALQILYQWEVGRTGVHEAIVTYWPARDEPAPEEVRQFAESLVHGTVERLAEVDALIGAHARNWRVERMAVIDRLVLRLAIYELLAQPDTPPRVVINEALELARAYSGEEPVPFINGILDSVRKALDR
ncbi:MAG TPA: transcription antitermination factor NusB [Vicinamibacterales bacterium]|nr:transcription antitermination factor NusB [Vicinamibacterales bacterium]